MSIWRIKPVSAFEAEMKKSDLKRVLTRWGLTSLGIGAIIGGGIFTLTGIAAHDFVATVIQKQVAEIPEAVTALSTLVEPPSGYDQEHCKVKPVSKAGAKAKAKANVNAKAKFGKDIGGKKPDGRGGGGDKPDGRGGGGGDKRDGRKGKKAVKMS
jgi:hypothetical protein